MIESPAASIFPRGIGRIALQIRPLSTSDIFFSLAG
jgi:hypothetical protein